MNSLTVLQNGSFCSPLSFSVKPIVKLVTVCEKSSNVDVLAVVELRWGPRGPVPPERPGSPRETSVLRGFKGACKRPPEITR